MLRIFQVKGGLHNSADALGMAAHGVTLKGLQKGLTNRTRGADDQGFVMLCKQAHRGYAGLVASSGADKAS